MSKIKIEKLNELKNASRFGTCVMCGVNSNEENLVRIRFNGSSVTLCEGHLRELMNCVFYHFVEGDDISGKTHNLPR